MAAQGTDLDPSDEEELLLIVAGMGFPQPANEEGIIEYWICDETKDCVSDLQRYLRRDDPLMMSTHRALGTWKTMQLHLIPLLRTCADDLSIVFNVLKVVVKLTMKPEQLGAKIAEHLKEKKHPDPLMGKYMHELQACHKLYKKAFLEGDGMGTVVRLLGVCLNEPDHSRSDESQMIIELILALLLNLLHTSHPDAPPPEVGKASDRLEENAILRKMIVVMEREHVLDVLLYVMQQVEAPPDRRGAAAEPPPGGSWRHPRTRHTHSARAAARTLRRSRNRSPRPVPANPHPNPRPHPQVEENTMIRSWNLTLLEIMYYIVSAHSPESLYATKPQPAKSVPKPAPADQAAEIGEPADAPAAAETDESTEAGGATPRPGGNARGGKTMLR